MKAFEYLVYRDEYYDEENERTIPAEIIVEPTVVLASSRDIANTKAVRAIPDEYIDDLEDVVHVLIREWNN